MYPDTTQTSIINPKNLIIAGVIVLLATIGGNYAYSYYIESQDTATGVEQPLETEPGVASTDITFNSDEQAYSIDYPPTVRVQELEKKYYTNSKRFFEGTTEFISIKKTTDPEFFKIVIHTQRLYRDDLDQAQRLTSKFIPQQFCPKGNYKNISKVIRSIENTEYTITPDIKGCDVPYTTVYETFTRPAKYIIEIKSNQPYAKIKPKTDPLINSLYYKLEAS